MALIHESTIINPTYNIGDLRVAHYDISFTLHQLVEPEPGWFLLNGATISAGSYPLLAARYGTTLPDYTEGKFPIGKGLTNFTSFGATGGEITHALTSAEMPSHAHGDTFTFTASSHGHTGGFGLLAGSTGSGTGGDHAHTYSYFSMANSSHGGGLNAANAQTAPGTTAADGSHGHNLTGLSYGSGTEGFSKSGGISNAGSGTAHNNMMPYIVVGGFIVKHD